MANKKNLSWLSASRGYAMFGVFLGHLLIAYINVGYEGLLVVGRFLEPIFVPFYLFIVGAFFTPVSGSLYRRISFKATQRLVPVGFYLLLVLPLLLVLEFHGRPLLGEAYQLLVYLAGIPIFSWPTWFLIALFVSELLFQPINKKLTSTKNKLLVAMLLLGLGWLFNAWSNQWPGPFSYLSMVWQVHTLGLFLGMMLLGSALRKPLLRLAKAPNSYVFLGLLLSLAVLVFSVSLNSYEEVAKGHVRERFTPGMMFLSAGIYGEFLPYLFSIISGAAALVLLCRLLPAFRLMQLAGEHALVLLGLNCIFHQVINRYVALYIRPEKDALALLFVILASFISFWACLPLARWLQVTLPQLVGKPMLQGPILPAIYRTKR